MTAQPIAIPKLALPAGKSRGRQLFWAHLRRGWKMYAVGMSAVIGTNITEVMLPKCVQWTVDLLNNEHVPSFITRSTREATFTTIVLVLILIWIVQGVSRRYWRMTLGRETHLVESSLRSAIWERARFFPMSRLQRDLSVGVLMNVGAGDVRIARAVFGWLLVGVTDVIFLGSFTLVAMFLISPSLSMTVLIISPVIAWLLRRLQKREFSQHALAQEDLSKFNDLASQAVATVKLQRLTQTAHLWRERLIQSANSYRLRRYQVVKTALSFFITMGIAPLFSYAAIFILGIDYVLTGAMTIGEFVAFQSYVLVLQGPLSELGSVLGEFQRASSSLERVTEVLCVTPEEGIVKDGLSNVPETNPLVEMKGVTFQYDSRDILKNLSLAIPRAARIGITGPIGSGKSTLLSIISGLERKFSGQVLLGGNDIRSYSHLTLRNFIGVVPQRPFLFAASVRENILLGSQAPDEEIWRLLEVVKIANEIRALPNGLDTMLGEWGINLSGGQKQRLTLARALMRKPTLLLLDDCLSAVDTITEDHILEHLHRELAGATIIWSAHRTSTLRYCDTLISLP